MTNVTKTLVSVLGDVNITNTMDQNVITSAPVVTSVMKRENALIVSLDRQPLRVMVNRQLLTMLVDRQLLMILLDSQFLQVRNQHYMILYVEHKFPQ